MSLLIRLSLIVLCLILIMLGAYLILVESVETTTNVYSSESTVCSLQYSSKLNPGQVLQNKCNLMENGWLSLSLSSASNLTVTLWANSAVIFNQTATSFVANLPLFSNGILLAQARNPQQYTNSLKGSLTLEISSPVNLTNSFLIHPYGTLGTGIDAVFGVLLILLIINPPQLQPSRLRHILFD
ncbi:MAG: hypothetical protein ACREBS_00965 [Nitrososphaerales archaeon]